MSKQPEEITRRSFLQLGAAGAGSVAMSQLLAACGAAVESRAVSALIDVGGLAVREWIALRRPDDLVVLDVGLVNLVRIRDTLVPYLTRVIEGDPALLVLRFAPQYILEEVSDGPPAVLPVEHLLADTSRLVFNVGPFVPLHLSIQSLLEVCARAGLVVAARAGEPGLPDVGGAVSSSASTSPLPLETALEVPFGIALSPHQGARFEHATAPVVLGGRAELWQTRLGVAAGEKTVRAIAQYADPGIAWTGSLQQADRAAIVAETAPGEPAIHVDQLALSALGAWFEGRLDHPTAALSHWDHRIAQGRDVHVSTVYRGRIWPFGHRASVVRVVDRRFTDERWPTGYLHGEAFVVIDEPERDFLRDEWGAASPQMAELQRQWPFARVRFMRTRSAPLGNVPAPPPTQFLPRLPGPAGVQGEPFVWDLEAVDRRGNVVRFRAPLWWMSEAEARSVRSRPEVIVGDLPSLLWPRDVVAADFGGQRVALAAADFASRELRVRESTTFDLHVAHAAGRKVPERLWDTYGCPFFPVVQDASACLGAIAALSNRDVPVPVRFAANYVTHGFARDPGRNPHEVFLQLDTVVRTNFVDVGAEKVGGLVMPNLDVVALSRLVGPVSAGVAAATGRAELTGADLFPAGSLLALAPKLFGAITLEQLLSAANVQVEDLAPRWVTETAGEVQRWIDTARALADRGAAVVREINEARAALTSAETELRTYADDLLRYLNGAFFADVDDACSQIRAAFDQPPPDPETLVALVSAQVRRVTTRLTSLHSLVATADGKFLRLVARVYAGATALRFVQRALAELCDVATSVGDIASVLADAARIYGRAKQIAKDKAVKVEWRPRLPREVRSTGVTLTFDPEVGVRENLLLSFEARAKQQGNQKAGVDAVCSIESFTLDLLGVLEVKFRRFQFRYQTGRKPEVDVVLQGLVFKGMLSFIQTLQEIVPLDGFSDPPAVAIDQRGLTAGYSIALPSVAVGVFSLQNIKIGAALNVPFLGDAIALKFFFSTREEPFLVSVSLFGGGGWFELGLTPAGLTTLAADIRFGVVLSANLGIASGCLSLMGGFTYSLESGVSRLEGFVVLHGQLEVGGGIASVSLDVSLHLSYDGCALDGSARVRLEVSVLFFSWSDTYEANHRFLGANGDPTLAQVLSQSEVAAYCDAFAT